MSTHIAESSEISDCDFGAAKLCDERGKREYKSAYHTCPSAVLVRLFPVKRNSVGSQEATRDYTPRIAHHIEYRGSLALPSDEERDYNERETDKLCKNRNVLFLVLYKPVLNNIHRKRRGRGDGN